MSKKLLQPNDLVAEAQTGSVEDLSARAAKLYLNAQVLTQSLQAQVEVARSLEGTPDQYQIAINVIQGLAAGIAEARIEAALLELEVLIGDRGNVSLFLMQQIGQIKAMRQMQQQQVQQQATPPATYEQAIAGQQTDQLGSAGDEGNGTSVAGEDSTDDSEQAKTPEDLVN